MLEPDFFWFSVKQDPGQEAKIALYVTTTCVVSKDAEFHAESDMYKDIFWYRPP